MRRPRLLPTDVTYLQEFFSRRSTINTFTYANDLPSVRYADLNFHIRLALLSKSAGMHEVAVHMFKYTKQVKPLNNAGQPKF